MLLKVILPMRNEQAMDCCAFPEAKNRNVKTRATSGDIHAQNTVMFFWIVGLT